MANLSKLSRNKRTESAKNKRARQPARTEKNRARKRLKHQLKYPGDLQAK